MGKYNFFQAAEPIKRRDKRTKEQKNSRTPEGR